MLENNVCSERHPELCDLGSGVGVAASVHLAVLSLSLLFRLQVPEPVCKGPITYQVLTLAGAA